MIACHGSDDGIRESAGRRDKKQSALVGEFYYYGLKQLMDRFSGT